MGVRTEHWQRVTKLPGLLADEGSFGVARPLHKSVRIGRLDARELGGEILVPATVGLGCDELEVSWLGRSGEGVIPALPEIVVDVHEADALQLQLIRSELRQLGTQYSVRQGNAEDPGVALLRDWRGGGRRRDLRDLRFVGDRLCRHRRRDEDAP